MATTALDHTLPAANTRFLSLPFQTPRKGCLFPDFSSPMQVSLNPLPRQLYWNCSHQWSLQFPNPKVKLQSSTSLNCQKHGTQPTKPSFPWLPGHHGVSAPAADPQLTGSVLEPLHHPLSHSFKPAACLGLPDLSTSRSGPVLSTPHTYPTAFLASPGGDSKGLPGWKHVPLPNLSSQTCPSLHLPNFNKWQRHCSVT